MQKAMMEAIKKKKFAGESKDTSDETGLAPESHGAQLSSQGAGVQEGHQVDESKIPGDLNNVNSPDRSNFGDHQGMENKNSKDKFFEVKQKLHQPANKNEKNMISGDGDEPNKDHLGIDAAKNPMKQGSPMSKKNLNKGLKGKAEALAMVKGKMGVGGGTGPEDNEDMGEETEDADAQAGQEIQPEFNRPQSRLTAGADNEDTGRGLKGFARVRAMMGKKV